MGRSTYSDAVKAQAVALYLEHGPAEAARRMEAEGTTIPQGTIRAWASHGDVATERHTTNLSATECARAAREANREQLRTLMIAKAVNLVQRMDNEAKAGECQHFATAAAILLDKFRLEMGEVTGRTEHIEPAREAEQMLDELAQRRQRNAA